MVLVLVSGLLRGMYYTYMRRQERGQGKICASYIAECNPTSVSSTKIMRRQLCFPGLQHQVRRLLDRLQEWQKFLAAVAELMERDAESVDQDLFEGAMGRRDVLFANRHVLRPHDYNLRRFEQDVSTKRSKRVSRRAQRQWCGRVASLASQRCSRIYVRR